jgi:hypothetical protein
MSPQRIQLSRKKGWRKPEGAVVVSRPSKWGNPFAVHSAEIVVHPDGRDWWCPGGGARLVAVELFRDQVLPTLDLTTLQNRDLACWCPLEDAEGNRVPCHADVLLEIANPTEGAA